MTMDRELGTLKIEEWNNQTILTRIYPDGLGFKPESKKEDQG